MKHRPKHPITHWRRSKAARMALVRLSQRPKEKTKPLPLYTEATLLKDLQRVAKYVKDPRIKQLLKDKDAGKKGAAAGSAPRPLRRLCWKTLKKAGVLYREGARSWSLPHSGSSSIAALPEIARKSRRFGGVFFEKPFSWEGMIFANC